MDLSLKIDVINSISPKQFREKYLKPQKPLIIKGIAENTMAGHKWSINYFKQTMSDIMIDIYDNKNSKSSGSVFYSPDIKMKFGDYLDIISKDEHTDLRIFLFNLFKYNPKLSKEFPCPEMMKGILDDVGFMFFGGKDTTVRIHYDIDMSSVLHTHFGGRKRVVLIAPEYNELLYRLPFNTYSLIDLDNPDYHKYPGLQYVKGYDFILEPGDSVFMPSAYWHYMTYLEGSFSVSYRKIAPTFQSALQGLINLGIYMPFDKLMNNLMGKKWLEIKKNLSEKRADQIIEKEFAKKYEPEPVNLFI